MTVLWRASCCRPSVCGPPESQVDAGLGPRAEDEKANIDISESLDIYCGIRIPSSKKCSSHWLLNVDHTVDSPRRTGRVHRGAWSPAWAQVGGGLEAPPLDVPVAGW